MTSGRLFIRTTRILSCKVSEQGIPTLASLVEITVADPATYMLQCVAGGGKADIELVREDKECRDMLADSAIGCREPLLGA